MLPRADMQELVIWVILTYWLLFCVGMSSVHAWAHFRKTVQFAGASLLTPRQARSMCM